MSVFQGRLYILMPFNITDDILTIADQISKIGLISEVTDHEKYEVIVL